MRDVSFFSVRDSGPSENLTKVHSIARESKTVDYYTVELLVDHLYWYTIIVVVRCTEIIKNGRKFNSTYIKLAFSNRKYYRLFPKAILGMKKKKKFRLLVKLIRYIFAPSWKCFYAKEDYFLISKVFSS